MMLRQKKASVLPGGNADAFVRLVPIFRTTLCEPFGSAILSVPFDRQNENTYKYLVKLNYRVN